MTKHITDHPKGLDDTARSRAYQKIEQANVAEGKAQVEALKRKERARSDAHRTKAFLDIERQKTED